VRLTSTQGSSFLATLGWGTESLWDSLRMPTEEFSCMKTEFHLGKLPKQKNDENQVLRLTETFSNQTERQTKTQNK
jgi:hypothetical protein